MGLILITWAIAKLGPMPPRTVAITGVSRILELVTVAMALYPRAAAGNSANARRHSEAATTFGRWLFGRLLDWIFI